MTYALSGFGDFRYAIRSLWDDYLLWSHAYVASASRPEAVAALAKLKSKIEPLADTVVPFCGNVCSTRLTTLLKAHVEGLVTVAGGSGLDSWRKTGEQIADLLCEANPKWKRDRMRQLWSSHQDNLFREMEMRRNSNWIGAAQAVENDRTAIGYLADYIAGGMIAVTLGLTRSRQERS